MALLAMQDPQLSADTINRLSADTINSLSAYTINSLSADTINSLSADTINRLSADTINSLSADTINANFIQQIKEKHAELLDSVPKLELPYTRMLEQIREGQRIHKQSTFGPECDPGENICGTPMCTAGHLVNMAGAAGYDLKNKIGWHSAAFIIHKKAHPDYPAQNFGNIDQDFAMAYIEEMAEREQTEYLEMSPSPNPN